jgi:hypothetical protein
MGSRNSTVTWSGENNSYDLSDTGRTNSVICERSEAIQSFPAEGLDCFGAKAPRNDGATNIAVIPGRE